MEKNEPKKEMEFPEWVLGQPTEEERRMAAYYRWVKRGKPRGDDLEDWFAEENKWQDNIVPSRND